MTFTISSSAPSSRVELSATDAKASLISTRLTSSIVLPALSKATARVLDKAGKAIDDVDRVEINEAFSSVTVNSLKMLGADPDKANVNGGAVALGHPLGASGARILGTMIYELRRNGGGLGLAAICSGGGQGDALLLEV